MTDVQSAICNLKSAIQNLGSELQEVRHQSTAFQLFAGSQVLPRA